MLAKQVNKWITCNSKCLPRVGVGGGWTWACVFVNRQLNGVEVPLSNSSISNYVIIYEAICERQGCLEKKIAHYLYTY